MWLGDRAPRPDVSGNEYRGINAQVRGVRDHHRSRRGRPWRVRAACEIRELGDTAGDAMQPLVGMLGDAAPVESSVCGRRSWRGTADDLTSPGEQAAAALVAIGTRAFQPVLSSLRGPVWTARRNAAWALGAFDDERAVAALIETLKDREPGVREQAAWALGALDDSSAVPALVAALKDADPRVRRQAAWALGAIDDTRASDGLTAALTDADERTRARPHGPSVPSTTPARSRVVRALGDAAEHVRKQAAWALGAIDDPRAVEGLVRALADQSNGVTRAGRLGARRHRRFTALPGPAVVEGS